MRKNTVAGAVVLGIAGLFLTGGIANAGLNPKISLGKSTAVAGEEIKVTGECYTENWPSAELRSDALETGSTIRRVDPDSSSVAGVAKVRKDIKPGTYTVSFKCGDGPGPVAKLTITAAKPKPTTSKPAPKAKEGGQVAVKPKGAADTGEGGDVVVEAAPVRQESSPGAGLYVLGGTGLAVAAGGAGMFMLRRRSRA